MYLNCSTWPIFKYELHTLPGASGEREFDSQRLIPSSLNQVTKCEWNSTLEYIIDKVSLAIHPSRELLDPRFYHKEIKHPVLDGSFLTSQIFASFSTSDSAVV